MSRRAANRQVGGDGVNESWDPWKLRLTVGATSAPRQGGRVTVNTKFCHRSGRQIGREVDATLISMESLDVLLLVSRNLGRKEDSMVVWGRMSNCGGGSIDEGRFAVFWSAHALAVAGGECLCQLASCGIHKWK